MRHLPVVILTPSITGKTMGLKLKDKTLPTTAAGVKIRGTSCSGLKVMSTKVWPTVNVLDLTINSTTVTENPNKVTLGFSVTNPNNDTLTIRIEKACDGGTFAEIYPATSYIDGDTIDIQASGGGPQTTQVATYTELTTALSGASSGDKIDVTADIEITTAGLSIPAGVEIYSSSFKRLYSNNRDTHPMLSPQANVKIHDLRLIGPNGSRDPAPGSEEAQAMSYNVDGVQVYNCEIAFWPEIGILAMGDNTVIHDNYIHHCQASGLGYGIDVEGGNALIYNNIFEYCRHHITSSGAAGMSYEAHHNLILVHSDVPNDHNFDMHGGYDRGDGTVEAGDWINIHDNEFQDTRDYAVVVRGNPRQASYVQNNYFHHDNQAAAVLQGYPGYSGTSFTPANLTISSNTYGSGQTSPVPALITKSQNYPRILITTSSVTGLEFSVTFTIDRVTDSSIPVTIKWGDTTETFTQAISGTTSVTKTHTYPDNTNRNVEIITHNAEGYAYDSITAQLNNAAPVVSTFSSTEISTNTHTFDWTVTDADDSVLTIKLDDNGTEFYSSTNYGSGTVVTGAAQHTITAGSHTITLTATDSHSATTTSTLSLTGVAAQDPSIRRVLSTNKDNTINISYKDNGTAVSQWWLYVGTGYGSSTYFDSGAIGAGTRYYNMNIGSASGKPNPSTGEVVTITLYWKDSAGNWHGTSVTTTYNADATMPDVLSWPANITSNNFTLTWQEGTTIANGGFWIYVGIPYGDAKAYYDSGAIPSGTTSKAITLTATPPDNADIDITFFWAVNGTWYSKVLSAVYKGV